MRGALGRRLHQRDSQLVNRHAGIGPHPAPPCKGFGALLGLCTELIMKSGSGAFKASAGSYNLNSKSPSK